MNMQEAMLNLKKMSLSTRFDNACKQVAVKNGVVDTTGEAMNTFLEQNIGSHMENG